MTAPSAATTLSVCIPAHNERATLGTLLEQVLAYPPDVVSDVLVCANGCTDGTEDLVTAHAARQPRLRLLHSARGKANAWNRLWQAAPTELRVFTDADVVLGEGALAALRQALLNRPGIALVSGFEEPRAAGSWRHRLVAAASWPFGHDYLTGRLYGTRRAGLEPLLLAAASPGAAPALPAHLVHEDLWLEVLVPRARFCVAPAAKVAFDPGDLDDLVRYRARIVLARQQVRDGWPDAYAAWQLTTGLGRHPAHLLLRRLRVAFAQRELIRSSAGLVLRTLLLRTTRQELARAYQQMERELRDAGGAMVQGGTGRLGRPEVPGE